MPSSNYFRYHTPSEAEEPASTIGFAAMADTANHNEVVAGRDEEESIIADT